jgi:hypothetical protein
MVSSVPLCGAPHKGTLPPVAEYSNLIPYYGACCLAVFCVLVIHGNRIAEIHGYHSILEWLNAEPGQMSRPAFNRLLDQAASASPFHS